MTDHGAPSTAQGDALAGLAQTLGRLAAASREIHHDGEHAGRQLGQARAALLRVEHGIGEVLDSLRAVSGVAGDLQQVALQTRVVAFSASVEARRAGSAGQGLGALAEAVKDLASRVEQSSRGIGAALSRLQARLDQLAAEIVGTPDRDSQTCQQALAQAGERIERIAETARAGLVAAALAEGRLAGLVQADSSARDGVASPLAPDVP